MDFIGEAAHKAAHGEILPNNQATLKEVVDLWPSLSLATQNRICEIATTEAAKIAQDESGKQGGK